MELCSKAVLGSITTLATGQRTARRACRSHAIAHNNNHTSSPVLSAVEQQGPGIPIVESTQGYPDHLMGRRHVLMAPALGWTLAVLLQDSPAAADSGELPKAYQEVVRKLSKALRESIQAEQAGDSEAEVRRKADPAKEALQTFVKRWRDDPKVKGHPSHTQVIAVLSELGTFYGAAGPRARMPRDLQARLLTLLTSAEDALIATPSPSTSSGVLELPVPGKETEDDDIRGLLPV